MAISKSIVPASYLKTTFAFLLDSLFAVVLMFVFYYTVGSNAILPALNVDANIQAYCQFAGDSGLASLTYQEDATTIKSITYYTSTSAYAAAKSNKVGEETEYGYKLYENMVWNYYTSFLPAQSSAVDADGNTVEPSTFTNKHCVTTIFGLKEDGTGNDYYLPAGTSGAYDLEQRPVLKEEYSSKLASDATIPETLMTYFYTSSASTGLYSVAISSLQDQPGFETPYNAYLSAINVALVPSIMIPSLIFFFLIPVFVPNGKTLGKLIFGLAVLGDDGYKAKKIFIILHYFIILVIWSLLAIPLSAITWPLFALIFIIDYAVYILSKSHQALHDKLSRTIVVDSRKSTWFVSEEDEDAYIAANPSSLPAKLRREEAGEDIMTGRRLVANDEALLAQDQVLDLSTINRHREEARNMTSFDDFEAGNKSPITPVEAAPTLKEEAPAPAAAEESKPAAKKAASKAKMAKKAAPKKTEAKKAGPKITKTKAKKDKSSSAE